MLLWKTPTGPAGHILYTNIYSTQDYQNSSCSHVGDHQGEYKGDNGLLKHICARCWLFNRKMAAHPKKSEICPFNNEGGS